MTAKITITGVDDVRARFSRLVAGVGTALSSTAVWVEDQLLAGAGRHAKTGRLERSVFKRRDGATAWQIGHDSAVAGYARFVVEGARPHVIVPRNKRALRWVVGNRFVFAKRVRHPGYRGDDYMRPAAARVPEEFAARLREQIEKR